MTPILGVTKDDGLKKPAIYKFYDFTKGGTDIVDQRSDKYTTSTKNRRWSIKTWEYMLDVTRVNSQTIHSLNHGLAPSEVKEGKFCQVWMGPRNKSHKTSLHGKKKMHNIEKIS